VGSIHLAEIGPEVFAIFAVTRVGGIVEHSDSCPRLDGATIAIRFLAFFIGAPAW
jgi:hypothetical protein